MYGKFFVTLRGIERGGQSLADFESGKRKVRATQGAIVPNRNLSVTAEKCGRK